MRILDKSISDDDLYNFVNEENTNHHTTSNSRAHQKKLRFQQEQSFKFESDDVMGILANLNAKLKDKL